MRVPFHIVKHENGPGCAQEACRSPDRVRPQVGFNGPTPWSDRSSGRPEQPHVSKTLHLPQSIQRDGRSNRNDPGAELRIAAKRVDFCECAHKCFLREVLRQVVLAGKPIANPEDPVDVRIIQRPRDRLISVFQPLYEVVFPSPSRISGRAPVLPPSDR